MFLDLCLALCLEADFDRLCQRIQLNRSGEQPLHVVHIISGLTGGGAEGALYRLLSHERTAHPDDRHTVVSLTDEGVYGSRIREVDVSLRCLGMPRGRPTVAGFLALYRFLRTVPRTTVVQTWMHHADLLGGLAARLAGRRRVVWGVRHSTFDSDTRALKAIAKACALLSGKIPEALISCSARAAEAHRNIGYRRRFDIVPNGYDLELLHPEPAAARELRAEWEIPADAPLIGMVARYTPQKDHVRLIEAFARLVGRAKQAGQDRGAGANAAPGATRPLEFARLVLVGEGCDPGNTELLAIARRHNVADRVILASRRNDIAAIMSALDVHVLSSASGEAFPNVVAEAMACGAASIATDVGDATQIVGDTGWIVPPANTTALCDAMREALHERLAQPQAAAARSEAARQRVASTYSLEAMGEGFRSVWKRVARVRLDLLAPSMRGGGAERVLSLIARMIDRDSFDVRLVLMQKTGTFLAELPEDLTVHDLGATRARYALPALVRALRLRKPDVVLSTLGYLNLLVAIARPFLPKRTRIVARESNTVTQKNADEAHPRLLNRLYRRYYRRFDRVVCQSRAMAVDLTERYRVPVDATTVIYNPVDAARVRAGAELSNDAAAHARAAADGHAPAGRTSSTTAGGPTRPDSRTLRLLAVGRLVPQKGFDLLLEALAGISRNVELTIAGEGPQRDELQELASRLPVGKTVHFAGFSDNPWALMVQSDVLVLSSRYEGLPNAVLEAGALGLPVIACDCPGGAREIVHDGENGLLIPCGDTGALARAIERFEPLRFDRAAIRERIEREHCPETIVGEYAHLLQSVAE